MRFIALVLAALGASPASAGFYDGNKMNDACRDNRGFVLGYAAGVYDKAEGAYTAVLALYFDAAGPVVAAKQSTATIDNSLAESSAMLGAYCTPKGVILSQVSDIFCQFLAANPADRQLNAEILFNRALTKAWPCKK
jgi:hypothetical protein